MVKKFNLFLFLLFTILPVLASGKDNVLNFKPQTTTYTFIENVGQVTDQHNKPRTDIDFKVNIGGMTVFIGDGKLHYQWASSKTKISDKSTTQSLAVETYRLDVILDGANRNANIIKEDKSTYFEQYYLPTSAIEGTKAYSYHTITYRNIYPGIDWVIYCNNDRLKYDFIVHKGAKARNIKLRYEGASTLAIEGGGLKVNTPMGSIYENPPVAYEEQSRKNVPSLYSLHDNILSFTTAKYDGTLVIDPVVDFATYYGDNSYESGNAVASDNRGNTYLVGITSSLNNIATNTSHQIALAGQNDGFIAAFDLHGARRWATYFGGVDFDYCQDAVCDPAGNIYVCGKTASLTGIATPPNAQQGTIGGGADDAFLMKFKRNGTREWGTYMGGTGSDAINNVNCDALGNIFVCGVTSSPNNISFNNPHQLNLAGQTDGFVARFTTTGQRQWATYYGGTEADAINFNACDLFGNMYVYGTTLSTTGIATPGVGQGSINSASSTTFLAKFNIAGTVQWGTYYGGTSGATPGGVVTDAIGDPYVTGYTTSTTGISGGTGQQLIKGVGQDGFIAHFSSSNGTKIWGSYFGNAGQDNFTGITISPKGRLFASGITTSNTGMTTGTALQPALNGTSDAFMSEWNLNGGLVYSSYLGGNTDESFPAGNYGSYIDYNFGKVYLCGTTNSTTGLSTGNGFQQTFGGGVSDAFMASFVVDTIVYITDPYTDTQLCEGQTLNLQYGVTLPFDPPNSFTVQLSDNIGNFAASTNIATVIANTGGTIACTIPLGILAGTGYRIRIVSSNPVYTSVDNGVDIRIDNMPQTPAISNTSPGCIDDTIKMAVTNPALGVNYFWNGPGYTGNAVSVSFNKANLTIIGAYTITPSIGGCIGVDANTNVQVNPTPKITTIGSNAPICEGETLFLNANTDMPPGAFEWTGPGFSSNQQNPSITNTTSSSAGQYIVSVLVNGCKGKDTLDVAIKHKPSLNTTSNSPVCETATLTFSATDADVQTQYNWIGPAGFTSPLSANSINDVKKSAAGLYTVTATNNGCLGTDTVRVFIKPMPFPHASNNSPVCSGEKLQLNVSTQQNTTKFNWYGPDDFNKTESNPAIQHVGSIATGLYRVIANLDGCIQEDTTSVTIIQAPTTVITSNSPVYSTQQLQIFASNNLGGAVYSWTGPNGFKTNTQNIEINDVNAANGGYYILKTDYQGCSSTDSTEITIFEFLGYGIFTLYPNPNNGNFTIMGVVRKDTEIPIVIWDMAGREVYMDKAVTQNRLLDKQIYLSEKLASGVYIISIRLEGGFIKKRFTITR